MPHNRGMGKTGGHRRPLMVVVEPKRGFARRLNDLCERDSVKALGNAIDWITRLSALVALLKAVIDLLL